MLFNSLSFGVSWTIESEYDPSVSKSDLDLNCKIVIPKDMVDVGRTYIAVSDLSITSPIHASDYHVVYNYAYAEITRKSVTVRVDESGNYTVEGLLPGHSLAQCHVNFENNNFDIVIRDASSQDVTNNYQLTLKLY